MSIHLSQMNEENLILPGQNSPDTLKTITEAAMRGYSDAWNAITFQLSKLKTQGAVELCCQSPTTLRTISVAAVKGYPTALDAIAKVLTLHSKVISKKLYH